MTYSATPEVRRSDWLIGPTIHYGIYTGARAAPRPNSPPSRLSEDFDLRFERNIRKLSDAARQLSEGLRADMGHCQLRGSEAERAIEETRSLASTSVGMLQRRAAAWALAAAGRRLDMAPESVRVTWWPANAPLAGAADCGKGWLYVRGDLTPGEVAKTVAHELRHIWQFRKGLAQDEGDAEGFAHPYAAWGRRI
jgi:hypothetical protein